MIVPKIEQNWKFYYPVLLLLAIIANFQSFPGEFLLDGEKFILKNPLLQDFNGLIHLWKNPQVFISQLSYTLFWMIHFLFDEYYPAYHFVNIFIHSLNSLLLVIIFKKIKVPNPFWGGVLFSVVPINVFAISWIFQTRSTLSLLFVLLSFLFFLKSSTENRNKNILFSTIFYFLALLSKANIVLFPVMLFFHRIFVQNMRKAKDYLVILPHFILSGIFGILVVILHKNNVVNTWKSEGIGNIFNRLILSGKAFWHYLVSTLFPFDLTLIYEKPSLDPFSFFNWIPLILLFLMFSLIFTLKSRFHRKVVFVVLVSYFMALFPILGFFDNGHFKYSFYSNHWAYFSSLFVVISLMFLTFSIQEKWKSLEKVVSLFYCFVIVLFSGYSFYYSGLFKSAGSLMNNVIQNNPNSPYGYFNLAISKQRQGKVKEAIKNYKKTLSISAEYPKANYFLGALYSDLKLFKDSAAFLEREIKINDRDPNVRYFLGYAYFMQKKYSRAVPHLERFIENRPRHLEALQYLGGSYFSSGHSDKAIEVFQRALKIDPDNKIILNNLEIIEKFKNNQNN